MISSSKFNSFFVLIFVTLIFVLNSCSERSEYGLKSDYEKFGAARLRVPIQPMVSLLQAQEPSKAA